MSDQKNRPTQPSADAGIRQRRTGTATGSLFLAQGGDATTARRADHHGAIRAGVERSTTALQHSSEQIRAERNKRLRAWMADVLNLQSEERAAFYRDMTKQFEGASDDVIAFLLHERLPRMVFMEDIDGAMKLIAHFQDIAEGWLSNTNDDPRS